MSPRPPRRDGQGDQRRAGEIVAALAPDWEIDVLSWLPDPDEGAPLRRIGGVRHAARAAAKSIRAPAHVAYVQAAAAFPLQVALDRGQDLTLFVTDRSVPPGFDRPHVIDFIDDMGGAAIRRGASGGNPVVAELWRLEGRRLRRWDRRLAARATAAFAVSGPDAAAIGTGVRVIPLALAAIVSPVPAPDTGEKVAFTGNLFYGPNHEAALWICDDLVRRLERLGIGRDRLVIAGRRPHPELRAAAARAGVELRADVPDLAVVLHEASVVIAPVSFGSGVQCKVLDAVGAGRACVLTAFANRALGLVDGEAALVRERHGDGFAEAVAALLADASLRRRLADGARLQLAAHQPAAVAAAWRDAFAALSPDLSETVGESEAV